MFLFRQSTKVAERKEITDLYREKKIDINNTYALWYIDIILRIHHGQGFFSRQSTKFAEGRKI